MHIDLLCAVQLLVTAPTSQTVVTGVVRDAATGRPLHAVVALSDLNRATMTREDGRYTLPNVPAGPQHIAVRSLGYAPRTLHALVPADGSLEINVSLVAAATRLPLTLVRRPVPVRGVADPERVEEPEGWASIAAIRSHPVLTEPDALQALASGHVIMMPEAPRGMHVRGGASDHTAYTLDGFPILNPFHTSGVFSAWNPDALSGVDVSFPFPGLAETGALSATIAGVTRPGADRRQTQGAVSTTHARLTMDGPIGSRGASAMLSLRSALPALLSPTSDASYLRGNSTDGLLRFVAPLAGGSVRVLGYDNLNAISAATVSRAVNPVFETPTRNRFEWRSRTVGAEWRRRIGTVDARTAVWSAAALAGSTWYSQAGRLDLGSSRRDEGGLLSFSRPGRHPTMIAARVERIGTALRLAGDSANRRWTSLARTIVGTAFLERETVLTDAIGVLVGGSVAATARRGYASPRARLRLRPTPTLALTAGFARQHQFAQTARNPESVVGTVFPADLFVGASAPEVPVARSDLLVLAADHRPHGNVRIGAQIYHQRFADLLLVAPFEAEPFATGPGGTGSGSASGVTLDGALGTARYGVLASWGWQRARFRHAGGSYSPDHGARHVVDGGVIVFPTATFSIRVGANAALGRRTTAVLGDFDWESCNLRDRGCEFSGSPRVDHRALGGTRLPPYLRIDIGFRKHWHVHLGGRDAAVALFGAVTNVLGRHNIMTYARNPSTGSMVELDMRPQAPLSAGLEWQF